MLMEAIWFLSLLSLFLLTPQMLSPLIRQWRVPGLASQRFLPRCSCHTHTPCITHKHTRMSHVQQLFPSWMSKNDLSLSSQQAWLRKFGYLSQASRQMSTMQSAQILSKAISDMQHFYGLEVTGEMDPATIT